MPRSPHSPLTAGNSPGALAGAQPVIPHRRCFALAAASRSSSLLAPQRSVWCQGQAACYGSTPMPPTSTATLQHPPRLTENSFSQREKIMGVSCLNSKPKASDWYLLKSGLPRDREAYCGTSGRHPCFSTAISTVWITSAELGRSRT